MSFEAMAWAVKWNLPVKQKIVLLMLANRVSPDTGRCFPSVKGLSDDCGMSETSVKEAIRSLKDAGLVIAHERRIEGVSLSNEYELDMGKFPPPRRHTPPKLSDETINEPDMCAGGESDLFSADEAPQQDRTAEAFERFWKVYPKKAAKPAAMKAWQKQIKAGHDPEMIIDAAARYAQVDAVVRGFVKHAQGWLNDQRWNDDDLPQPAKPMTLEERARRLGPQWGEVER